MKATERIETILDATAMAQEIASLKVESVRSDYKQRASRGVKAIRRGQKLATRILRFSPELQSHLYIHDCITLHEYGGVTISMEDKAKFAELQLNLIDRFGVPEKSKTYDDNVQFSWKVDHKGQIPSEETYSWETDEIHLTASPEVNGCKLITTEVEVPEETKVIPAHTKKVVTVECD